MADYPDTGLVLDTTTFTDDSGKEWIYASPGIWKLNVGASGDAQTALGGGFLIDMQKPALGNPATNVTSRKTYLPGDYFNVAVIKNSSGSNIQFNALRFNGQTWSGTILGRPFPGAGTLIPGTNGNMWYARPGLNTSSFHSAGSDTTSYAAGGINVNESFFTDAVLYDTGRPHGCVEGVAPSIGANVNIWTSLDQMSFYHFRISAVGYNA